MGLLAIRFGRQTEHDFTSMAPVLGLQHLLTKLEVMIVTKSHSQKPMTMIQIQTGTGQFQFG